MRNTDKVYRYGGEEFAIICTETDLESAIVFAERLRKVISDVDFQDPGKASEDDRLTISIGVSNFPANASKFDELLKYADDALYRAKAEGRNKVVA